MGGREGALTEGMAGAAGGGPGGGPTGGAKGAGACGIGAGRAVAIPLGEGPGAP